MGVDQELMKLGALLANTSKRQQFHLNAEATMKQENIDASVIPPGLIDTLKGLPLPHLEVVSNANVTLRGKLTAADLMKIVQFPV